MNLPQTWPTAKAARAASQFYKLNVVREEAAQSCFKHLAHTQFPVQMCSKAAGVVPAIEERMQVLAHDLNIDREKTLRVFVANLSYAGPDASKLLMSLAQLVGDAIASNPVTSCALIIMPNVPDSDHCSCAFALPNSFTQVGERGDSTSISSVAACQAATLNVFRDSAFKLHIVEVHWQFLEQSIHHRNRPLHHSALLCISDSVNANNDLTAHFSNSYFFTRQGLPCAVPALAPKEFVRPSPSLIHQFGARSHRSATTDSRQWITGSRLYSKAFFVL